MNENQLFFKYLASKNKDLLEELNKKDPKTVRLFTKKDDFENHWKDQQFSIIPLNVVDDKRWVLVVIDYKSDKEIYPWFFSGYNWYGWERMDKEIDEAKGFLKPTVGDVLNNVWNGRPLHYNNYISSQLGDNPDGKTTKAYIASCLKKILERIKDEPIAFESLNLDKRSNLSINSFISPDFPQEKIISTQVEVNAIEEEMVRFKLKEEIKAELMGEIASSNSGNEVELIVQKLKNEIKDLREEVQRLKQKLNEEPNFEEKVSSEQEKQIMKAEVEIPPKNK